MTSNQHQVLALKWRPRNFNQVVGQMHVVQALTNAMNHANLHHAYLFTGTRGVGKTSIARIIAKCLNCKTGITANPCGQCNSCQEIDAGHFPDLYEVDAASRTKVEDTRELLENVQYAPTKGRFKIYLIDEVHMLSGHSFNALLKTLEEPPLHVKFLLATTDHQRLPATVLSRCLQFHLTQLDPEQIAAHLQAILQKENIEFDDTATLLIGKAADGSLRDALSLLDQGIAYGNGKVSADTMRAMLGTIEPTTLFEILHALSQQDANRVVACVNKLSEQSINFSKALADLLSLLHQIAIAQVANIETNSEIQVLAKAINSEDVQLYYQIGSIGQRDLPFSPSPRIGFEMILLRMLAFTPQAIISKQPQIITGTQQNIEQTNVATTTSHSNTWNELLPQLNLDGATLALAQQCSQKKFTDTHLHLLLHAKHKPLLQEKHIQRIRDALSKHFKKTMMVTIDIDTIDIETPASLAEKERNRQQLAAEQAIHNDDKVQRIMQTFDAKIIKNSITPVKHH